MILALVNRVAESLISKYNKISTTVENHSWAGTLYSLTTFTLFIIRVLLFLLVYF